MHGRKYKPVNVCDGTKANFTLYCKTPQCHLYPTGRNMDIDIVYHAVIHLYLQALYTALHRLKEVLIITDDLLRIQYANRSAERLLNMRLVRY